jgi:putative ABC transport system permease protein
MTLLESLRMALAALVANKGRSALTVLGVVIGIAAVIGLVSVGQGAQAQVESSVAALGSNLLYVRQSPRVLGAKELSQADVEAMAGVPNVVAVAPEVSTSATVSFEGQEATQSITGTTSAWVDVRSYTVAEGRFLTDTEVAKGSRVAVVGGEVAADLGMAGSLLGQTIKIDGLPFTTVGVLESKGSGGMTSGDSVVVLPATTVLQRLTGGDGFSGVGIEAADEQSMAQVEDQVTTLLRQRHKIADGAEDDFTINNQADLMETMSSVTGTLTALLGSIAGISLLVGGIGIMNIMLVSVTERTRDIGIRKAIGARRSDIMGQFLIESLVLSVFGGVLGVVCGYLLSRAVGPLLGYAAVVTPEAVGLAVGVSAAIGVFFGVYPAWKASRQDPIEALRYE